ncbi:hypothetical protein [Duganella radicis]|uniref:Lipoprotein n=1 Tax=Duganella radicis TaxID=551988 RepID=A0A6L6PEE9_9BURK|nr:hypothetical protein [Duganella radicis]MTV37428.1 hypothetical protein [Duganella radicis]
MKHLIKPLLILVPILLAACSPPKDSRVLKVTVKADTFIVNSQTYLSSKDLTAALRKMPHPDAIAVIQEHGISPERHDEAMSAIQSADLKVPIGFVGNEVFY